MAYTFLKLVTFLLRLVSTIARSLIFIDILVFKKQLWFLLFKFCCSKYPWLYHIFVSLYKHNSHLVMSLIFVWHQTAFICWCILTHTHTLLVVLWFSVVGILNSFISVATLMQSYCQVDWDFSSPWNGKYLYSALQQLYMLRHIRLSVHLSVTLRYAVFTIG